MVEQAIGAGILLALGYLVGADGQRRLVVCPCGPDGKTPLLPDLRGQVAGPSQVVEKGVILVAQEYEWEQVELHKDFQPRGANTTYGMQQMAPSAQAKAVLITVLSTLDQAVTVQAVGHVQNAPKELNALWNIEASQSLAAGNTAATKIGMGIDLDINRYPYLGVTIATTTAPTAGNVQVYAYQLVPRKVTQG